VNFELPDKIQKEIEKLTGLDDFDKRYCSVILLLLTKGKLFCARKLVVKI
jgi:hypothetical protein